MKNTFILICILLLGLLLRIYNLNFPSVGYHNMKENEVLSIAQEMERTENYIQKRVYFKNAFERDPVVKDDPQPPLVSYQTLLAWRVFGENIWGGRLLNVIFGVASILVVYLIGRLLFGQAYLSLFCAFLTAVLPLAVFFSRNLQAESPAFFFMLLGQFLYLRFILTARRAHLIWGGLSVSLAALYKFPFLIGALPFLWCFSFPALFKDKKDLLKSVAYFLLPYSVILLLFVFFQWAAGGGGHYSFRPFGALGFAYWKEHAQAIAWYIKEENFTSIFSLLAGCGMLLVLFKKQGLSGNYILGWMMSMIVYILFFSEDIYQNSYSQLPFLLMVCVSSAYALSFIAEEIKKLIKIDVLIYLMVVCAVLSISSVKSAIFRMHGTVFLGQDVAGETLKEITGAQERVFLYTHAQGYAVSRYAHRYVGWPSDLEDFKKKEEDFGVRFICFYPGEYLEFLRRNQPAVFEYILGHYRVKEVGLIEGPNKLGYLILEKGKGKNIMDALQSMSGKLETRSIYKVLGKYVFFYTIRPPQAAQ